MRFAESLVIDRAPGANGHLGGGSAAEAVIGAWVAGIDERTVFQEGEAARLARAAARLMYVSEAEAVESAPNMVQAAAGHTALALSAEAPAS